MRCTKWPPPSAPSSSTAPQSSSEWKMAWALLPCRNAASKWSGFACTRHLSGIGLIKQVSLFLLPKQQRHPKVALLFGWEPRYAATQATLILCLWISATARGGQIFRQDCCAISGIATTPTCDRFSAICGTYNGSGASLYWYQSKCVCR